MVSQVAPQDALPSVRMVQLGTVLRTLAAGWNRLNPQLFAIRTTLPKYVDTTVAPASELMWLRTTLVCREGSGWEVLEFCEAIGDLPGGIDEEILFPETVLEVITLAHKRAMPAENLGFFMPDYGLDFQLDLQESLAVLQLLTKVMTRVPDMSPVLLMTLLRKHPWLDRMESLSKRIAQLKKGQTRP